MSQLKPTRTDYIIAVIGLIPVAVASVWRSEIATWANVAPKFALVAGVTLSVVLVLTLTLLIKKDRQRYRVRGGSRAIGLGMLLVGIGYLLMREGIADLFGLNIRICDGLMLFAGVLASMWLLSGVSAVRGGEKE